MTPKCAYCGNDAKLVSGRNIYGERRDLDRRILARPFWHCAPCKAWVGCHPGTETALGRLANEELRRAKQVAHATFDPLWKLRRFDQTKSVKANRSMAYQWLAGAIGVDRAECHIGEFDVDKCKRVVEACHGLTVRAA